MEIVLPKIPQATQEDIYHRILKERQMTKNFVKSLIHENATYDNDGLSLYVSALSRTDKKLFLSYVVDANEYGWLCENETRLYAAFDEYKDEMQFLIDQYIDDVWHESMQEKGLTMNRHNDNGEVYYYKR